MKSKAKGKGKIQYIVKQTWKLNTIETFILNLTAILISTPPNITNYIITTSIRKIIFYNQTLEL